MFNLILHSFIFDCVASVPRALCRPFFLCCICVPLDIKVPPLKEVVFYIAFLPPSPGSSVPANQGLLLLNVCAYDAPPLPLRPPSNGQISPHNITRCCLVTPPADNIVLFDNIVPPQLIVVLFAYPLISKTFQIFTAHHRPVNPYVLCPCAPPSTICLSWRVFLQGRSNSMWKRKRPFKSLRKI